MAAARSADERRVALQDLEHAARLAPHDARVLRALADGYLASDFAVRARETYERVLADDSTDAQAWRGVARTWKHDWIMTMDRASLARAALALERVVRLDGTMSAAWAQLAALRYEQGDGSAAGLAAAHALAAGPGEPDAMLAGAFMAYRSGRASLADSLFAAVLPVLPAPLAARFEDATPLLPRDEAERLAESSATERREAMRRFWSESNPDPTAPYNSAQLEFRARVAYMTLLMDDPPQSHWDARAEMVMRYGPPRAAAYEPPGVDLARPHARSTGTVWVMIGDVAVERQVGEALNHWYPLHVTMLSYPQFGMLAPLEDASLNGNYEFALSKVSDGDPVPDTNAVALAGMLTAGGGRAVFPRLPPLVEPHELATLVTRFQAEDHPRLLAHVKAPGGPADSLVATCVVVDSSEHEIERRSGRLSASSCDAATVRTAEFAFDLPPGPYRVAFAVQDRAGRRGVARAVTSLASPLDTLQMSDLVPVCGTPDVTVRRDAVRLDAKLPARVRGREPLLAYFEVYHLHTDEDGASRFEYEYTVHSRDPDRRPWYQRMLTLGQPPARLTVRSSQAGMGPLRRQYIAVPTSALGAGRYRLSVEVRDGIGGALTRRSLDFEKLDASMSSANP